MFAYNMVCPSGLLLSQSRFGTRILEKFERGLAGWKKLYKGGQLTLLKSTLLSLPTYIISSYLLSLLVWQMRFRNDKVNSCGGGLGDEFKHHLNIVNEGLGIRELTTFNQDL